MTEQTEESIRLHEPGLRELPETPYDIFVTKYCNGHIPTKWQEPIIRAYLADFMTQALWINPKSKGKSTVVGWLRAGERDRIRGKLVT